MCIDMCIGVHTDMCMGVVVAMCIDMCLDMNRHVHIDASSMAADIDGIDDTRKSAFSSLQKCPASRCTSVQLHI